MARGRELESAEKELAGTRAMFERKMVELEARWRRVEAGQLELKQNLVRFNNFVREKEGKVESGEGRVAAERARQAAGRAALQERQSEAALHLQARAVLAEAVEARREYSDYLEAVVADSPAWPAVPQLMERCQALVQARWSAAVTTVL